MSKGEKKKTSAGVRPANEQKQSDKSKTTGQKSGRDGREDRSVDKSQKRKAS